MANNLIIYIVRHGETDFNVNHITQGHTDSQLSQNGINQAEKLAQVFKDINFDVVYSSDLLRAKRTAEIITLGKNLPINTSKLLRERSYGNYDGKLSSLFVSENKEMIEEIKTMTKLEKRKFKFADNIESDDEINSRMMTFLNEISELIDNKIVLVTTHGGIMRSFLNYLEWSGEEELKAGAIKNTGYFRLKINNSDFIIDEVVGVDK